jgi:hypothetical protein
MDDSTRTIPRPHLRSLSERIGGPTQPLARSGEGSGM